MQFDPTTIPGIEFMTWVSGLEEDDRFKAADGAVRCPLAPVSAVEFDKLAASAAVVGKTLAQKYPGRTSLTTAEAALVLGRQKGTLLVWASKQNGPIRPVKSGRKNLWPIAELQKIAA